MAGRKPKEKSTLVKVNISTGAILKIIFLLITVALVYFLRNIVAILLLSLLLAALIDPFAGRLQKKKIPRGFAVAIVYFAIIVIAISIIILVVPTVFDQSVSLLTDYAPVIEQALGNNLDIQAMLSADLLNLDVSSVAQAFNESGFTGSIPAIMSTIADFFGGLLTVMLIFILAFYLVAEEGVIKKELDKVAPEKYKKIISGMIPLIRKKVGSWLHGQLLLMLIIFILTFLALTIAGIPYALVLALIAGVLEIVPYLGPILSVIPATVIAFSISPLHAFIVMALYFLIQQLEGEVLTPKIMQKVVGLNPVVSILSILVGYEIAGVVGAMIAIPSAIVIGVFLNEWYKIKSE